MKASGLSNKHTDSSNVNLDNFFINRWYANAFTKGLANNPYVEKLTITKGSLTDDKLKPILNAIPHNLKYLDISGNPGLSKNIYPLITSTLSVKQSLISLGIEECNLGDHGTEVICNAVAGISKFRELKLSKNRIGNLGALHIANMLKWNQNIWVLLLHWNEITSRGGIAIAQALERNEGLAVLDMSYN